MRRIVLIPLALIFGTPMALGVFDQGSQASVPGDAGYRQVAGEGSASVPVWRTADMAGADVGGSLLSSLPFVTCMSDPDDRVVQIDREAGAVQIRVISGPNAGCRGFVPTTVLR
jgi:hypothetical protein